MQFLTVTDVAGSNAASVRTFRSISVVWSLPSFGPSRRSAGWTPTRRSTTRQPP